MFSQNILLVSQTMVGMVECKNNEKDKLWEFSIDKSNWMCVQNRKRKVEEIEVEVRQGKLKRAKIYKYLGNIVNEKGNMDDQLKYMEQKLNAVVREAKNICCQYNVGRYEMESKKLVYELQLCSQLMCSQFLPELVEPQKLFSPEH